MTEETLGPKGHLRYSLYLKPGFDDDLIDVFDFLEEEKVMKRSDIIKTCLRKVLLTNHDPRLLKKLNRALRDA